MQRVALTLCLTFSIGWCGRSAAVVAAQAEPAKDTADGAKETAEGAKKTKAAAKVRKFTFQYRFRVKNLAPTGNAYKDLVRVWLPRPSTSDCQQITELKATAPAQISETKELRFGNRLLYFQTAIPASGEFNVDIPYEVTRQEVLRGSADLIDRPAEPLDADMRARLLGADKMVPTAGKPLELLAAVKLRKDKLGLARQLYDIVDDHVSYRKDGTGWGRGDSNWVCDSGYGNCTDFHSLFMSLARSQGLPARFEIGFSIPAAKTAGPIVGYHCWAWFYLDERGWIPVDISEADKNPQLKQYYFGNLSADRVTFSLGRDLELVPKPAGQPLNFLIYPYIEVGGETLPKENVELQFAFEEKEFRSIAD